MGAVLDAAVELTTGQWLVPETGLFRWRGIDPNWAQPLNGLRLIPQG